MPDQPIDELHGRGLDAELGVVGLESLRHPSGAGGFIVRGITVEADRERLDRLVHQSTHDADDDRRVDAGAEERAEWHVADEPSLDGGGHELAHTIARTLIGSGFSRTSE